MYYYKFASNVYSETVQSIPFLLQLASAATSIIKEDIELGSLFDGYRVFETLCWNGLNHFGALERLSF